MTGREVTLCTYCGGEILPGVVHLHKIAGSQAPQAQPPPSVSCSEWVEELTTALWKLEDLRDKAQKARGDLDEYRAFEEILDLIQNAMKLIRSSSTARTEALRGG